MTRAWSLDDHGDAQVVVVCVPFAWHEPMGEVTSAVYYNFSTAAPSGMRYCPKRKPWSEVNSRYVLFWGKG